MIFITEATEKQNVMLPSGMRNVLGVFGLSLLSVCASTQSCPTGNSIEGASASVLHGRVVYHDELRQWLGLKLDRPACDQKELQLVYTDAENYRRAKALRGCTVTASGKIYEGLTGYYSVDMALESPLLTPDASCKPLTIEPDLSLVPIPADLDSWRTTITVDYRGKGHVGVKVWKNSDERSALAPWQAYVNYMLNGGADIIWFGCRAGFDIQEVSALPPSESFLLDAVTVGIGLRNPRGVNTVTFSCRRDGQKTR